MNALLESLKVNLTPKDHLFKTSDKQETVLLLFSKLESSKKVKFTQTVDPGKTFPINYKSKHKNFSELLHDYDCYLNLLWCIANLPVLKFRLFMKF